jgi:hypothetical protein
MKSRSKKNSRQRRRSEKKIKGGCGCSGSGQQPLSLFSGGGRRKKMKGGSVLGPASLTNYDTAYKYTYPLNIHNNDPLNPTELIDTRQLPNFSFWGGGRKRKNRRTRRKMKGGLGNVDQTVSNYNSNTISNFALGTTPGALVGTDIISGRPITGTNDLARIDIPFL